MIRPWVSRPGQERQISLRAEKRRTGKSIKAISYTVIFSVIFFLDFVRDSADIGFCGFGETVMDDEDVADQAHCMKLAQPLLGDFHEAWEAAFAKYLRTPAEIIADYDDTTVANCIRAFAWKEIARRFGGRRHCRLMRYQQLNLLNYRDETLWRFKQVNGAGRHANYQTPQQRHYDLQLPLPGVPPEAIRLTSGYQPDATLTTIQRVIVSRPYGKSMRWAAQVNLATGTVAWQDISPARFTGTGRFDVRKRGEGK
jgi:hypothetical protein